MTVLLVAMLLSAPNPPDASANEKVAFAIGSTLRCPVCQGMPIAESPSEMAQAMMGQVRELVAAGKGPAEIEDHFVERYGEWVLLNPRRQGLSWTLWILPPLVLGALLIVFRKMWKGSGQRSQAQKPVDAPDSHVAAVRAAVDEL